MLLYANTQLPSSPYTPPYECIFMYECVCACMIMVEFPIPNKVANF